MKLPIVLSTYYPKDSIEVEILTAGEVRQRKPCPTCGCNPGGPDYGTLAVQALEVLVGRCAGGFYDALRAAIYAYERKHGRLP